MSADPLNDERLKHLSSKERFECAKLSAEAAHFRRWWFSPGFFTALAAISLAAGGVIVPWKLQVFNVAKDRAEVEQKKAEAQRTLAEYETKRLADQRALLDGQILGLKHERDELQITNATLTNEIVRLREELRLKDEFLTQVRRQVSNELVKASNSNKVIAVLYNELKRIEADRDRLANSNEVLVARISALSGQKQGQRFHGPGVSASAVGPDGTAKARVGDVVTTVIRVRSMDDFNDSLIINNIFLVAHHAKGDVTSSNLITSPIMLGSFGSSVKTQFSFRVLAGDVPILRYDVSVQGTDQRDGDGGSRIPQAFFVTFPDQLLIEEK